jgi:hypothetical protein
MGKVLMQLSTDPVVRRRVREAHVLRAQYVRAALARLLRSAFLLFGRSAARCEQSRPVPGAYSVQSLPKSF